MNVIVLKNAGIDYEHGVKRFAGRAHLFEKALAKFLKDSTFSRIRAAYLAKDNVQLLADTHEFKGMSGNIALNSLYETADTIVRILRSEKYTQSDIDVAYAKLEKEYNLIYGAVVAAMEE